MMAPLIQKQWSILLVGAIVSFLVCISDKPASSASSQDAGASVASFYDWYLHELTLNHDPLKDNKAKIDSYVSAPLIREIEQKMNTPDGMESDYFIQAQDYLDDWPDHIAVSKQGAGGAARSVTVTLGSTPQSTQRLRVGLIKSDGIWKIRSVTSLEPVSGD